MTQAPAPFHPGEREVQRRAGVQREAARVGGGIQPLLIPPIARFLATQRIAVTASLDARGRPWASLLTGRPGFLDAASDRLLRVAAVPTEADPLAENLRTRSEVGLLVIDPRTRQRVRVNGRGVLTPEGLWVETAQVYGNCPKYVQKRRLIADTSEDASEDGALGIRAVRSSSLRARHREWIAQADTFFIASFHPQGGADASHRGGRPGFVRVLDPNRLAFADYPGNNMFNTLGNLCHYSRAGLLFVDFETGDLLQLTGRTEVHFAPRREVVVHIEDVLARDAASPLRWELLEPSPANPEEPSHGPAHGISRTGGNMSKEISCGDVVPGCSFKASAASEEELVAKVSAHASKEHGVKEVTPELAAKVKAAIRSR